MSTTTKTSRVALVAIAIVSASALSGAVMPETAEVERPPGKFSGLHRQIATTIDKALQRGAVSWQHTGKPCLTISWIARAGVLPAGTVFPPGERHPFPATKGKQSFPTKGYVTAVRMVNADTLIVAEVSDWSSTGETVLYLQQLVWPAVMPKAETSSVTGETFVYRRATQARKEELSIQGG